MKMDRIFPKLLDARWKDPKGLIQVFTGPRQVGKTTAVTKLMNPAYSVYASADLPTPPTIEFIESHWEKARQISHPDRTLVLDEVQKIPRWSEVVKKMWDEDKRNGLNLRVCLLGSSAILIEKGLSESLTGRFEVNYFPHWTYAECKRVFEASPTEYCAVGGYPKAYDFRGDAERGDQYLETSIIEPTLGRDVLALHAVDKPALLRQLFWYASRLPAQIVSYEKILGHLQGRGNSATLVHYAHLLSMAFILVPLFKFSPRPHRAKNSIPKWILPNPALVEKSVRAGGPSGFVFENLVGSHLLNIGFGDRSMELFYWREDDKEVDFIVTRAGEPLLAIEVKSGRIKNIPNRSFLEKKKISVPLLVVHQKNIESYLQTNTFAEVLSLVEER